MEIDSSKLDITPSWSHYEINRWADYIELLCLKNKDISIGDFELNNNSILSDDSLTETLDHAQQSDTFRQEIIDYFKMINYRKKEFFEFYPFVLKDNYYISLDTDLNNEKYFVYFILLISSSISFMDSSIMIKYTKNFEKFCELFVPLLSPNGATVELFGTARNSSKSECEKLKNRVNNLAENLCLNPSPAFMKNKKADRITVGDAGIDIVTYFPIDKAGPVPFSLGQCTCSYNNWIEKQGSIDRVNFSNYITVNQTFAKYMFVPFSCQGLDGSFVEGYKVNTFLIDRFRILRILQNNDGNFFKAVKKLYSWFDINNLF